MTNLERVSAFITGALAGAALTLCIVGTIGFFFSSNMVPQSLLTASYIIGFIGIVSAAGWWMLRTRHNA